MKTDDFKFLVECAIKAPSGHNSQPWKFENTENGIIIHPDFKRSLPVVDADNYELYYGHHRMVTMDVHQSLPSFEA